MKFDDPHASLNALPAGVSERKLRLFACGCARLVWDQLWEGGRELVEAAEGWADDASLRPARGDGARLSLTLFLPSAEHLARCCGVGDARAAAVRACGTAGLLGVPALARRELLRCIFGNPFQPDPVDPRWRTGEVLRLAEAVYEERAFDRLPVLADLVEEAGVTDARVLAHLRGPGPHARGCFALDAVLGRK
jgi:hypothetical protein